MVSFLLLLCVIATQTPVVARTRAATTAASITVHAGRAEGRISPLLYGQFIEFMFEGIKGGLHAELLRDRGFEDAPNSIQLPRYWERYPDDRNDDYGLNFKRDDRVAYPSAGAPVEGLLGGNSLRVEVGDSVITRHGLYQPRVPVRGGVEYPGYLWLKTDGYAGRVRVALESDVAEGETYAEADITGVEGDWKKYEFTLRPKRSDPLARFCILFDGRGRLWLDQASLMPGDAAVGGVRRDVFERAAALSPAFLRYPGGNVAQDYHWEWGVGARDARPSWINLSWKNEPEPSDFGTDEFIQLCRRIGAEPSITVNVEGRGATAEEAAAWVEYCNGAATTKYGRLRARNGHPEPYHVKYWEVGNEIWGSWVRGHTDAETYARNYRRYAEAMRRVDPTIKLIAVGDNDMRWNRTVLTQAGGQIDYLSIHHYYNTQGEEAGDPLNLSARPLHFERFYREVAALVRETTPVGRDIKLAINEWGLALPVRRQYSIESALYAARLMNVFERAGDAVAMSAVSDLVNGWPGGIVQANRHALFVSPIYLVNQLYATHLGAERLDTEVTGPTFDTSREGRQIPYLDAVASRSADGTRIFIKAVNTHRAQALDVGIHLKGARVLPRADVAMVIADSLAASNSFKTPEAVSIRRARIAAGSDFRLVLPKHSVALITLRVSKQ
ncbi:MAG: alpha-L-arabinofuranosidase C-terminal domain-containing protein [Pyrinomonadaceae bacterium]